MIKVSFCYYVRLTRRNFGKKLSPEISESIFVAPVFTAGAIFGTAKGQNAYEKRRKTTSGGQI